MDRPAGLAQPQKLTQVLQSTKFELLTNLKALGLTPTG
jgi:hypothetical protein